MKKKYVLAIAAIGLGLATTLFVVEKQKAVSPTSAIWLKSHGEVVAELRLVQHDTFEVAGGDTTVDMASGRMTSKGDVTIQISHNGNLLPITVKADEIDELPGKK